LNDLSWQQLANLRPSLPAHIYIQQRYYGDELWYLLHDKATGRFHRFNSEGYQLISLMDGHRNLEQILKDTKQDSSSSDIESPPSHGLPKEELVEMMQYLHAADLLLCDVPPNAQSLFERKRLQEQQKWRRLLSNPLVWRFPLMDPDALLNRMLPVTRFLIGWPAAAVWLIVIAYALMQTATHWTELTADASMVLIPQNLLWLWITYPLLKILHEAGHALYTKAWGGEVHEFGVVFIMATPLPYVDATAATGFAQKRRRLMVGAAGIAVELFIAALAMLLWLQLEAGQLRILLFNVMWLGSVSALFFNGNPLMRFDGYHLLCDAIDFPNLGNRANQQIAYAIQRHLYGVKDLQSRSNSVSQAVLLSTYGIASFCYRMLVLAFIILMVWRFFPTLGATLAVWLVVFQLVLPLSKLIFFIAKNPRFETQKRRILTSTLASLLICFVLIFYVPFPLSTRAEGVLWLSENAQVRAQTAGFVEQVLAKDGDFVKEGQPLLRMNNMFLVADWKVKQAKLKGLNARYHSLWGEDRVKAKLEAENIEALTAEITMLRARINDLTIRSQAEGQLLLHEASGLPGRYLEQGDTIAFISQTGSPRVRVAIEQHEIGLVRGSTLSVEAKLAQLPNESLHADISQEVPEATFVLPSPVLGSTGGGRIVADNKVEDGTRSENPVFLIDLSLPDLKQGRQFGERVYIYFRHPPEPWASRVYRRIRQHFLKKVQP